MHHLKQMTSLLFTAAFLLFGWSSNAKAIVEVYNYYEIWVYGTEDFNNPDIRWLVSELFIQSFTYGTSIDDIQIVSKSQAIINDLHPGINTYGFDIISTTKTGPGMYGYFSDPSKAYVLEDKIVDGGSSGSNTIKKRIVTRLFGLVWIDDRDDVAKSIEDGVPNLAGSGSGDGNGDGIPDSNQSSVTSLKGVNDKYLTLSNTQGLAQRGVRVVQPPSDVPPFVTFPFGMLEFNITGVQSGGTVTMKLYVPKESEVNSYWKKNRNTGVWEDINPTITTENNKKVLTFTLTDGGPYDADGVANGVIQDPGGPGVKNGRGSTPSVSVPLLSGWGMTLLITLLGLLGMGRSRKIS